MYVVFMFNLLKASILLGLIYKFSAILIKKFLGDFKRNATDLFLTDE